MEVVDTGTTAFMLCCIIGLTLMIPGLALFYGGMSRSKSVLNMMMMSFIAAAIVGILYVAVGWSMGFGGNGTFFANPFELFWLDGVTTDLDGYPQKAVDTNGAGDTHTGVLVACRAAGMPWVESARRANAGGAIKVTRRGPATAPTAAEIDDFLAEQG